MAHETEAQPQETVTLQVQDAQGRTRPVPMVVRRGWDERRRCVLLGLGSAHGLALALLTQASRELSPVVGFAVHDQLLVSQVERDGRLQTPEYYCTVCSITVRSPQTCPCCQGPMELRMRPDRR